MFDQLIVGILGVHLQNRIILIRLRHPSSLNTSTNNNYFSQGNRNVTSFFFGGGDKFLRLSITVSRRLQ